jgi:hypothetical protein
MENETRTIGKAEYRISYEQDDIPDLSHLGEYSDEPVEFAIDRKKNGDMERNEYRYFNPENCENMEQAQQNYDRMESYNRGSWSMLGITVTISILGIEIESASLWGIESDSGKDDIEETITNLIDECNARAKNKVEDMWEIVHILEEL